METNKITVIAGFVVLVVGGLLFQYFLSVSSLLPAFESIIMGGSSIILMVVGMIAIMKLFW